jgi:hypothetical protein
LQVATNGVKTAVESDANTEARATEVKTEAAIKHIDRDEVFGRLEKILATVKLNPVTTPEVNAEAKATTLPASTEPTPAQ